MTICTISPSDLDELERLNKALILAETESKEARWVRQAHLLRFIETHPTLLPFCIAAGREKMADRAAKVTA